MRAPTRSTTGVLLRERNQFLLAAGYAPAYGESELAGPELKAVRDAVRLLLAGHEPYPAAVVDPAWNLVEANTSLQLLVDGVAPELLAPPLNVLRVTLHPDGMAPSVLNLGEWRAHLLGQPRRQAEATADPGLAGLLAELVGYPCDQPGPEVERPGSGAVFVPLGYLHRGTELTFFTTVATFGTRPELAGTGRVAARGAGARDRRVQLRGGAPAPADRGDRGSTRWSSTRGCSRRSCAPSTPSTG
ncbi:hypothetical protein [Amycolatopsis sp. PS_44_ISF1]|uniref:MmyB family transcriptional regulator n=1 Tax=Amycolatopsis sp. PS_44_ISF1 TaxID=2974917 RepID=UPI0028DD9500|nr:hypothetical protein [Amycolatopsis sp. PS_44_ISF1]MDT8912629.1 hypothetical protein [Amycolatopsis sp. PS_44_ISF1]